MVIRSANVADAYRLVSLWREAGLRFEPSRVPEELASVLARDSLVLVDIDDAGEIAGAVLGTFDGRRGWVNRLAVRVNMRGRGIAAGLMASLEERLAAVGCAKVNLLIEPDNAEVTGFYARLGYQTDDLVFMEKWLAQPPKRDLSPELASEPYVFAAVAAAYPPAVAMFAAILEDEGLTLVLTKADADMAGLEYSYVSARITLRADSALQEVRLTALVSSVLADEGISCNVIAGVAHDHLFVDWHRGEQAVALLHRL